MLFGQLAACVCDFLYRLLENMFCMGFLFSFFALFFFASLLSSFCAAYLREVHRFVFAKLHLTQQNTRI